MDSATQSRINLLNQRHFRDLGWTPYGSLRWQWMHSTNIPWYIMSNKPSIILGANGLPFAERKAEKFDWSYLIGETWVLVRWKPPMDEAEWQSDDARARFPWPKHGEYVPIESFTCEEGTLPDDDISTRAAYCIREHLRRIEQAQRGHTGCDGIHQVIEANQARRKAFEKSQKSMLDSLLDDTMTAFGKSPGKEDGGIGLGRGRNDQGHIELPTPLERKLETERIQ